MSYHSVTCQHFICDAIKRNKGITRKQLREEVQLKGKQQQMEFRPSEIYEITDYLTKHGIVRYSEEEGHVWQR